jgi:signal peptidase I
VSAADTVGIADGSGPAGPEPGSEHDRAVRSARHVAVVLTVAALTLVAVRVLLVQSFVVPTTSMEPTLGSGDRVLVSRLDHRFGSVHRGDIIVFSGDGVFDPPMSSPDTALARAGRWFASAAGAPVGEHDYVKRVIGLPGEHVTCCDAEGRIAVDGVPLDETYLPEGQQPSTVPFDIVVPAGRLWVLGDNRGVSRDSRAHLADPGYGTVPLDHVVGRVVVVWWPASRAGAIGRVDPRLTTATAAGAL